MMFGKKVLTLLAVAGMTIGLFGTVLTANAADVKTIRIAHGQPETHPEHVGLLAFKEYIETNLGDKYKVEIYPNELMGGSAAALELMQAGSLEMVVCSTSNMEAFDNTYKIFGIPYLFTDWDSYETIMNTDEFIDKIYHSTAASGVQGVCWFKAGTRSFYSAKPINSPEDMNGMKVRIQASDTNVKMVEALGAAGTVLSYGEVYTALQQGVIDAAESPEMALVSHKHGEVAKYYANNEHQIMPDMLAASTMFMNSIAEEDKAVFDEAFSVCNEVEIEAWDTMTEEIIASAEEMGVTFLHVDKAPFMEAMSGIAETVLADYPEIQELYDMVQEIQGGN